MGTNGCSKILGSPAKCSLLAVLVVSIGWSLLAFVRVSKIDMSEEKFNEIEQNIRKQHEADLESLIEYLRRTLVEN